MSQPPPLHFPPEYMAQRQAADDVPIPTDRAPPRRAPTRSRGFSNAPGTAAAAGGGNPNLRRGKTLTRPERGVAPAPLINPPATLVPGQLPTSQQLPAKSPADSLDAWRIFAYIVTFWAPPFLLSIGGLKDKPSRQAWREKVALCFIAILLGATIGFATIGLDRVLCPPNAQKDSESFFPLNSTDTMGTVGMFGYRIEIFNSKTITFNFFNRLPGFDVTPFVTRSAADFPACNDLNFRAARDDPCAAPNACPIARVSDALFAQEGISNTTFKIGYDWDQVALFPNYLVIDGAVLNFDPYVLAHPNEDPNDPIDKAIRSVLRQQNGIGGKDATKLFLNRSELKVTIPCLVQRYYAGNIDKIPAGCFISQLFLYFSMIVILGLVLVRFAMACIFSWFMSARLVAPPKNMGRKVISPAVMPEGANVNIDSQNGTAPWAIKNAGGGKKLGKNAPGGNKTPRSTTALVGPESNATAPVISLATIGEELFTVCLVTCYSEGEESIRTTLDSISVTNYSDERKLLFIVCDGMITGAGEKMSTPDICVGLLDADPRFGNPQPMSYTAVGLGSKMENRAMVYAGHYAMKGRRTPTVIIVKCGTEAEAASEKKPGNRGKRDSQLILMNFFSRVTYNDRMTPLDYDLFRKTQVLMGVTPDFFEVTLMVDADTKVYPDSLKQLVNCMQHDNLIMGVCGETRIANKRQSWVTAIQVYEYFISHHLAKAFESVFGGVTCLPGCFSMYRLKARKVNDDDWVPLITKPEIVREYSQSEVTTLHQKNLLLLGEDRFLTTILLRTFPNRKMMFCPQAKCRTIVPDTFSILLSQRRRWINSTIHNLMELVLVRNLCGTFCFSMQFIVFMDLIGTVVLPVAISLTYALVVILAMNPPKTFEEAIPLMLLVSVIGLPAVLILITTRKIVYVFWMLIYLVALPVWNFILPVYSFWHFDDFSWGETRKVEGEGKQTGHDEGGGTAAAVKVPMRRWEDWERSRLRKLKREDKRRRELERTYPGGFLGSGNGVAREPSRAFSEYYDGSDTMSVAASEDDQWGTQIGGYNENASQWAPPPATLLASQHHHMLDSAETLRGDELEAMLENGFEQGKPRFGYGSGGTGSVPPSPGGSFLAGPPGRPYQLSEGGGPPSAASSSAALIQQGYALPQPAFGEGFQGGGGRSSGGVNSPAMSPTAASSAVDWKGHVKKRSGGRSRGSDESAGGGGPPREWGPLGPLDPAVPPQPPKGRKF